MRSALPCLPLKLFLCLCMEIHWQRCFVGVKRALSKSSVIVSLFIVFGLFSVLLHIKVNPYPQFHSFHPLCTAGTKPFWSKTDLFFCVGVTWGLPWQPPAVSNASLPTFLEAHQCVTLETLPASHIQYIRLLAVSSTTIPTIATTTTTVPVWPPSSPINNERGMLGSSLYSSFNFFLKQTWRC